MFNARRLASVVSSFPFQYFFRLCVVTLVLLATIMSDGCSSNLGDPSRTAITPGRIAQHVSADLPRITVDKSTYDYGRIKLGTSPMAVFRLTNSGSGTLRITDVKKCCGAVVKLEKSELAPNESGVLTVEYRAGQVPGPMTKKVVVVTNDPKNPQMDLTITGDLIQTLAWNPTQFTLPSYAAEKCPQITIKSLDGTAFSIKGFTVSGQALTASFDPNHKATEFTLKPIVDMVKLKALASPVCSIVVSLDHPDYKTISVPFEVIQPLQITPPQVLVFNAKVGESVLKVVQVRDNQADPNVRAPAAIESVTAKNGSRVELRTVWPQKAGCDLKLEIWPAKGKDNEAFSSDQLVVKLKDGRQLTVPLRVFFQSPTVSSAAASTSKP